jgi:hypothetical protein
MFLVGCGGKVPDVTEGGTPAAVIAEKESTTAATTADTTAATTVTTANNTTTIPATTINTELYLNYPTHGYEPDNEMPYRINPAMLRFADVAVNELFKALTTNDSDYLELLTAAYSDEYDAFEFIKDIKFDGFEIISSEYLIEPFMPLSENAEKSYVVTVNVLESTDERFPVGLNTYEITYYPGGWGGIGASYSALTRVGDEGKQTIWNGLGTEAISENVRYCYLLSTELGYYIGRETTDTFEVPDESPEMKAGFHSSLLRFLSRILPAEIEVATPEILNEYAKKVFGFESEFNEENFDSTWLGANCDEAVLVSETENSVTIDYYADCLLLVKAYTVKYNFDKADGFRFTSIEKIYDSGFDAANYST